MFPMMALHWKKKKKMPKNLTTQGLESSPLISAILTVIFIIDLIKINVIIINDVLLSL